jgi:hypothetical protein
MSVLILQNGKNQTEPIFPICDEQLRCELEKMNKNGKLIFYTYACRLIDPLFIVTTFTDRDTNNSMPFQMILVECIPELEKTAKLTGQKELKFLHVGMTEQMPCDKCIERYGASFNVKCFYKHIQSHVQEFALVSININVEKMEQEMFESLELGLNSLLVNGVMILEVGSIFNRGVQNIIWKLVQLFEQVKLVKPHICSKSVDTKYIICCGYRHVKSFELPSISWYSYLNSLENDFTKTKNSFQRRACEIAKLLIAEATGVKIGNIDCCLRHLSNLCLQDENLRKFATLYYQENKLY